MPRLIDLTGLWFGRLRVISQATRGGCGQIRWLCTCTCGQRIVVLGGSLRCGGTRSCGCLRREVAAAQGTVHGGSTTPEYRVWAFMLRRCYESADKSYSRYGGRGIRVCKKWHEFAAFLSDMGSRPTPNHTLERINNDGDYQPGNCTWDTRKAQSRNRPSFTINVNYKGRCVPLSVALEMAGERVKYATARKRIVELGWPVAMAIETTPRAK